MILSDYPIESKRDDKLKRAPLARKVADLISGFEGPESFVIGIEGAWGSGKTSFVKMVLESLGNKVSHLDFNPWNFSDQNSLLNDFFSSFSEIEPIRENKNLKEKMAGYARKLCPQGFQAAINFGGFSASLSRSKSLGESLSKRREDLNEALNQLDNKVVVTIDDIDRLDTDETKLIFKLVKMTANFPNTIFILAYDRKKVEERLTVKNDGFSGSEYLKKIIQVSFMIPQPESKDLHQILFEDLDRTTKAIYGKADVDERWSGLFWAGVGDLFSNIRDIRRFINSLRLDWSIVSKENITPTDFIGIEAIRVFAPEFYSAMGSHKHLFTAEGDDIGLHWTDVREAREKEYEELLKLVPENIKQTVHKICEQLFPSLNFNFSYSYESEIEWRKDLRVCSKEKFDFYFSLSIPTDAVSETELKEILAVIDNREDFLKIMGAFNEEKLRKILSRLMDYLDEIEEGKIKGFILNLWQIQEEADNEQFSSWDIDTVDTLVTRLSYHSVKKKIDEGKRGDFAEKLIRESGVFYPAINFATLLVEEKSDNTGREILLQQTELERLKPVISEKFSMVDKNYLKNSRHLSFLLFRWKRYGQESAVDNFVADLLRSKSGTAIFLSAFVVESTTYPGHSAPITKRHMDKKTIDGIYPIKKVEKIVGCLDNEDLDDLNNQQREAIELFKDPESQI